MLPCLPLAVRTALIAGLVGLALAGCGRRGPLEPPPDAAVRPGPPAAGITLRSQGALAGADTTADDGEEAEAPPSAVPAPPPTRRRRQGYVVPREPFLLDPLL